MKRFSLTPAGGCLLALFLLSPAARADDKEYLQGTWKVAYATLGDKTATAEQRKVMSVVVEGNHFTLVEGGTKESVFFFLRPGEKPRVIEFRLKQGDTKTHWHGIYEIRDGKVRLCWGPAEQPRPNDFSAKHTGQTRFYVLERTGGNRPRVAEGRKHESLHRAAEQLREARKYLDRKGAQERVETAHRALREAIRYVKDSRDDFGGRRKRLAERLARLDDQLRRDRTRAGKALDEALEDLEFAARH